MTTATHEVARAQRRSRASGATSGPDEVVARLAQRTYSPVLRAADMPAVTVPWGGGRRLRFEYA